MSSGLRDNVERLPSAEPRDGTPDPWLGCQWVHDSPLTGLLEAAAEWEIESTVARLA